MPNGSSDYNLNKAIQKLNRDRNMHIYCPWDSKLNFKRNKTINRLKRAACLDDYRDVYPTGHGLIFVYQIKPGLLFMENYQLTILNLYSLRYIN